ncbi:MAG: hypothetical protein NC043_03835 [Muribaculaceae bacterium]|nr:hypothetical protein [Muribaculaceae bacterium]
MKRIFLALIAGAFLTFTACKTTEANYRAAYEIAKEKRMETGDSTVTAGLKNELTPRNMVFGTDTLPVRTISIGITKDGGGKASGLRKFNIVVAQFRQLFNAKSMRERLMGNGFPEAFVIHDRDLVYYVVAASTAIPSEAASLLAKVKDIKDIRYNAPYPYVLIPVHFAR